MCTKPFTSFAVLTSIALVFSVAGSDTLLGDWSTQRLEARSSFRGLSAVNGAVVWASGSSGGFARTLSGGLDWQHGTVPGGLDLDFRTVRAFDANTAYLLSSGPGEKSRIYKTTDGGHAWRLQFTNNNTNAFFSGMAFWE